jgi:phosphoserine phosphatase
MLLRLTYQLSNGWQDMLKYYTTLNEERKLDDEKSLLAHANMKLEEILEFGDSYNDLPMFKEAAEKDQ